MIIDAILEFFLFIPNFLINLLPDLNITIPEDVLEGAKSLFGMLGYVFPISKLLPILVISFTIKTAQITWSIGKKVYELLPFIN